VVHYKIVLSITTKRKWKVKQMDIKNGHLKEEVYMEIPKGFEGQGIPSRCAN
jgi:hypothetical protein